MHPPGEDAAAPPSSSQSQPLKRRRVGDKDTLPANERPGFEGILASLTSNARDGTAENQVWSRPMLKGLDAASDDVTFQQIEIDELSEGNRPLIRIFGVTNDGHSVLAHVNDFLPYFWIAAPPGFMNSDCGDFANYLNGIANTPAKAIHSVSVSNKRSLWGYRGDSHNPFLKISINDFKFLARIRGFFEKGEVRFRDFFDGSSVTTYESNIAYTLRFMIDLRIVGMNWLRIPKQNYTLRTERNKISTCQIEMDCSFSAITSFPPDDQWASVAPLRILSFDIECAGRKGIFPEAEHDPVIQIANMVTVQGKKEPFVRNIFTLSTCAHIVGSQIFEFDQESMLLSEWRRFVSEVDPDLIIGYNTANFDIPYLMDRAKHLKVSDFPYLGRLKNVRAECKDTHFSSKAYGTRDSKETKMDGRLQLDLLSIMQRDYKLRSYSLNAVSAHFLGEQKEDVPHSIITELQNGTAETRRRLAVYCLKDAFLPQRLLDKLMCFINYTEMARVTGIPFNYLLSRGQQIKVISQLYRKANDEGYLVPALRVEGSDEQYEGATVIEPTKGYYDVPIATLDFASLYPSIMMAHNLCYTTLLDAKAAQRLNLKKEVDYIITPNNDYFVKPSKRKGLLPTVLEDLLSARKRARADLKKESDPFVRAVLDGRQLALKISANSVYGFTGATIGKLPCLPISMSVTAFGRHMIMQTKEQVEAKYTKENGYEQDAKVIYGDTDSVMVKFGVDRLEESMRLGAEAAETISETFTKPIRLEFEKVYYPYLLISKKRYAGLFWTKPEKHDKMDAKGIETVRRDNCRLVQTVIETCLRKMLIDQDVKGAEDYTKQIISELLQNKVDMSQLVITKALAKTDYAAKQAHVELAERMKKRDAGSAPALGDRVAYVIVKGTKDARAYEKSEDPLYVLENNIPIDTKYYLDNQLSKPLMRIFEPILGDKANSLLSGDHTRVVQIATPTTGGLIGFVKKTLTCMGCKTPLPASKQKGNMNTAVCKNCRPRAAELYARQLSTVSSCETSFGRLWTQCQRCQGSLHQDVLCTSSDCPIYYMRKKAQKDVVDAHTQLGRFDGDW